MSQTSQSNRKHSEESGTPMAFYVFAALLVVSLIYFLVLFFIG